jgi:hypothetical protein
MGADSSFRVYFADRSITLRHAFAACARLGPVMDGDEAFAITIPNATTRMFCGLNDASWVVAEAREQAQRHGVPALAACDRCFEVTIENLDHALQDYNTLFAVQEYLADLTHGWVTLAWNGELLVELGPQ